MRKAECPLSTRDLTLNLRNRQSAIEVASYGPLNPDVENSVYWGRKAAQFKTTIEDAKSARCGNCAAFVQTEAMMQCIVGGIQGDESAQESFAGEVVDAADLGYCELFDFKCAAARTCDAWLAGGPIDDEEHYEEVDYGFEKADPTSNDVHTDTILANYGKKKRKKKPAVEKKGGLGKWFEEKWVDLSRPKKGGGFEECGRPDAGEGKYPKCVPSAKAESMSPSERKSAVRRKRQAESKGGRDGKKPINVPTFAKSKNVPTDKELYARVKAEAKRKFDVYPSAYANAWLVQEYKRRGGKYRTEKASSPAWQRKEGKNPKGGLNAKGRASYARETGGKLKPPVKRGNNIRRGQFLTRMGNMAGPERKPNGEPTRLLLSLQAWGASSKADAKKKGAAILEYHRNKKEKA